MQIRDVSVEWFNPKTEAVETVTFRAAPTPLPRLAELRPHFGANNIDTREGLDAVITALYYGARRAGAQITLEWLLDNIDMFNGGDVLQIFGELNGMKFTMGKPRTEANGAAGEPVATGSGSLTTSPPSSPTS